MLYVSYMYVYTYILCTYSTAAPCAAAAAALQISFDEVEAVGHHSVTRSAVVAARDVEGIARVIRLQKTKKKT